MKKIPVLLLLLLCYTLSGYGQVFGKLTFSDSKDWIPNDFNPKNDILLIEEFPDNTINEKMVNYVRKNYRGNYEIVSKDMIMDVTNNYSNTEMYKYAFLWVSTEGSHKPTGHFFERAIGKHYPTTTKKNRYQTKNAYMSYIETIDLRYKK